MERWNTYLREADERPVVKVVLFNEDSGKLLLLRRSDHLISDSSPWEWDLPGGHTERGEGLRGALERETWEETGLILGRLVEAYRGDKTTFYLCTGWAASLRLSDEHKDYEWVYPEEVSNYNVGESYETGIKEALKEIK